MSDPESVLATAPSPAVNQKFIIDQILRRDALSLISGPSNSGKTILMLQMLSAISASALFFGHPSCAVPFCIVSCDRPVFAIDDTMASLGLQPGLWPHFSLVDPPQWLTSRPQSYNPLEDYFHLPEILSLIQCKMPDIKLVVLDCLPALCPGNINLQKDVSNFCREAGRLCRQQHVAMLGTIYATKNSSDVAPIDRIFGSGAWAAHTDTKFILEPQEELRTLHILSLNGPPEHFDLQHDPATGLLVPVVDQDSCFRVLDTWLLQMEPGAVFTTSQAKEYGESQGISARTVERWLKARIEIGIMKIGRGEYRKMITN